MIDVIIPLGVLVLIFYLFGLNVFLWALGFGAFCGVLAIVWLFVEKDPAFIKYEKWAKNIWNKVKKEVVDAVKDLFSL